MKCSPAYVFLEHSTKTHKQQHPLLPDSKATTVPLILFENVLQSPAHLKRGAKLSDRADIIQLKSVPLEQSYHIIQAPEVA